MSQVLSQRLNGELDPEDLVEQYQQTLGKFDQIASQFNAADTVHKNFYENEMARESLYCLWAFTTAVERGNDL